MVERFLHDVSDLIQKEMDASITDLSTHVQPDEPVIKYLRDLQSASSYKIETTVEHDEKQMLHVYRLRERLEELTAEKIKLEETVLEREKQLSHDLDEAKDTYKQTLLQLQESKHRQMAKQEKLDQEVNASLERKHQNHLKHMDTLNVELSNMTDILLKRRDGHRAERSTLMDSTSQMEKEKTQLTEDGKRQTEDIQKDCLSITTLIRNETKEKQELQAKIQLIDRNEKIAMDEEKMLQKVKEMEEKADYLLDVAASHLQRLYRGAADRAFVTKLRAKKAKKSKGKGKGKGKKK